MSSAITTFDRVQSIGHARNNGLYSILRSRNNQHKAKNANIDRIYTILGTIKT